MGEGVECERGEEGWKKRRGKASRRGGDERGEGVRLSGGDVGWKWIRPSSVE